MGYIWLCRAVFGYVLFGFMSTLSNCVGLCSVVFNFNYVELCLLMQGCDELRFLMLCCVLLDRVMLVKFCLCSFAFI